jgi:hypothetical protein
MRHLHERLREAHHLKHFGRMQYGLFLKVCASFQSQSKSRAQKREKE